MIKFRQKDFALPALLAPLFTANGLMASTMIGGTAISAVQGHKAAKASEEQHEQMLAAQKRENAKLTKALNNLAEQAKNNPQAAIQAGQMVGQSRMYSVPSNGFIGNVIKFGKDIASASHLTGKGGKKLLGLGTAGVLTAGVGYGVDKSITRDARKIGLMPENRSVEKAYSSVLSQVGAYAKKAGKYMDFSKITNNKFVGAEGTYTIKVTAKDEHGNIGSATLQVQVLPEVYVDTEKPVIAIQTAESAAVGSEVEVKYLVTDNVSSGSDLEVLVSVVKDGAAVQLSNGKFTAEAGTYTITITAKDAAGNIATASKDVVVSSGDTTAPTVKITTPTTASVGEEVLVTYTASDDTSAANKLTAVVKVEKDGAEVTVANNKFTAEAGTYTITVTVTDEAGNSSVATSTVVVEAAGNDQQAAGCVGSVAASIFGILTLGVMAFAFRRRKQD